MIPKLIYLAELLIYGILYYIYNLFISLLGITIIGISNPTKFLKLSLIMIMIFYEYILLPPRWIINLEIKKFKIKNPENYTYGETPYLTTYKIIKDLSNILDISNCIFIDLGCGVGKTVFLTNIVFNLESIGVDNIQTFIQKANKIKSILKFAFSSQISFIKADILEFLEKKQIEKKPIFYIPSTAFSENFFESIIDKIANNFKNAILITMSKTPNKKTKNKYNIVTLLKKRYYFSWGKSTVYILIINSPQ